MPNTGWAALDPSSKMIPGEKHVTPARGRDFGDVTQVKGVVRGRGVQHPAGHGGCDPQFTSAGHDINGVQDYVFEDLLDLRGIDP